MLHRIILITVVFVAPMTALAGVAPRTPGDLGLPSDCDDGSLACVPEVPCEPEATATIPEPGCAPQTPDRDAWQPVDAPELELPPHWRPQVGHLPVSAE